jgi:hypothetical protein
VAPEQVLRRRVLARPQPGPGGREQLEEFKHALNIADACSRDVLWEILNRRAWDSPASRC